MYLGGFSINTHNTNNIQLLLLEALQLQRSFGLLNEFFPFGSVSDAVLPVTYYHVCYITFNIILPPMFGSSVWSLIFNYINYISENCWSTFRPKFLQRIGNPDYRWIVFLMHFVMQATTTWHYCLCRIVLPTVVCDLENSWMRRSWPTKVMSTLLGIKPKLGTGEVLMNIFFIEWKAERRQPGNICTKWINTSL
jgi:hypothetical protein